MSSFVIVVKNFKCDESIITLMINLRLFPKKIGWSDLLLRIIAVAIVMMIITSFAWGNWSDFFIALISASMVWLPILLPKRFNLMIPKRFLVPIVFFLFASLVLGEYGDFYEKFWWWDLLLHTFSAVGFGLIGIVIILIIYKQDKIKASPIILAMFAFTFALSIGALWEIFEYAMDQFFGLNMQKSGLDDTMSDLMVDSVGSLIAAAYGYYFWKLNSRTKTIANEINQVIANNFRDK